MGSNIGGVAVDAADRIMALAGPSEVVCVDRRLAEEAGSPSAGSREVKGLHWPIEVYRLA